MNPETGDNIGNEKVFYDPADHKTIGTSIIQDGKVVHQTAKSEQVCNACLGEPVSQTGGIIFRDDVAKLQNAYQSICSGMYQSVEVAFRFYPSAPVRTADLRWGICFAKTIQYKGKPAILIDTVDYTKTKKKESLTHLKKRVTFFDRIATRVAHEIRNPLTAINSYAFTLKSLVGQEFVKPNDLKVMDAIIAQIQGASHKIESFIKRLMDIARVDTPKMRLTDINQSIEEIINLLADTLDQNGIVLEQSLAAKLPYCYADPRLIRQVIMNLICHAYYSLGQTDNPKIIRVSSCSRNNTIQIVVSDSGPSLPSDVKNRIFDHLMASDLDDNEADLSIVQKIVAFHDGTIEAAESKWGGNEFRINLPIEKRGLSR